MNEHNRPIPFLDLKRQHAPIRCEIQTAIERIVDSTVFVSGPEVAAFEEKFAAFCGTRYSVALNSGTSALHLALIACGIGPGDEVITVPMTFVATSWAISYVGARPVFVDVDADTCTMDVNQVGKAITPRTRAILPVHLYGQMADMDALEAICQRHNLALIEDAAQSHGAACGERRAGSVGRVGCFSFYPGKNLGGYGEGGAITTNDEVIAPRLRALRDHAQSKKYHHDEIGFNYRMDEIQAAVLKIKLGRLEQWNAARAQAAENYRKLLSDTAIVSPAAASRRTHVWHLYVTRHPHRERLREALTAASIGCGLHYPVPVHLQPAYAALGHGPGDFPVSEQIARECLSLPMYPDLNEEDQMRVVSVIKRELARH
jgi:dTDP-4-amino-4,6-dideoxygalactose transaminase